MLEGTSIDVDALLWAVAAGEDEDDLRDRFPALPYGALRSAVEWDRAGRPSMMRVVLGRDGHVVEGTSLTAKMLLLAPDSSTDVDLPEEAIEAAEAWRDSYAEIGATADEVLMIADSGPEVWACLTEEERASDPHIVAISPAERRRGTHTGYCAIVWMPTLAGLRIVPVLSTDRRSAPEEAAERARLLETGRTMLITWERPRTISPIVIERMSLPLPPSVEQPMEQVPEGEVETVGPSP